MTEPPSVDLDELRRWKETAKSRELHQKAVRSLLQYQKEVRKEKMTDCSLIVQSACRAYLARRSHWTLRRNKDRQRVDCVLLMWVMKRRYIILLSSTAVPSRPVNVERVTTKLDKLKAKIKTKKHSYPPVTNEEPRKVVELQLSDLQRDPVVYTSQKQISGKIERIETSSVDLSKKSFNENRKLMESAAMHQDRGNFQEALQCWKLAYKRLSDSPGQELVRGRIKMRIERVELLLLSQTAAKRSPQSSPHCTKTDGLASHQIEVNVISQDRQNTRRRLTYPTEGLLESIRSLTNAESQENARAPLLRPSIENTSESIFAPDTPKKGKTFRVGDLPNTGFTPYQKGLLSATIKGKKVRFLYDSRYVQNLRRTIREYEREILSLEGEATSDEPMISKTKKARDNLKNELWDMFHNEENKRRKDLLSTYLHYGSTSGPKPATTMEGPSVSESVSTESLAKARTKGKLGGVVVSAEAVFSPSKMRREHRLHPQEEHLPPPVEKRTAVRASAPNPPAPTNPMTTTTTQRSSAESPTRRNSEPPRFIEPAKSAFVFLKRTSKVPDPVNLHYLKKVKSLVSTNWTATEGKTKSKPVEEKKEEEKENKKKEALKRINARKIPDSIEPEKLKVPPSNIPRLRKVTHHHDHPVGTHISPRPIVPDDRYPPTRIPVRRDTTKKQPTTEKTTDREDAKSLFRYIYDTEPVQGTVSRHIFTDIEDGSVIPKLSVDTFPSSMEGMYDQWYEDLLSSHSPDTLSFSHVEH
ncbi:hypothetical protein PROFUN_13279 [Planoprotostelium fungivorum]|uniref:Uncharacterized protein n=1 Tax=Planoprotostelium fungivorum TaxID=1890364 RepID=A0A2P6N4T9_9EUKA|nr:hypothetical protein PROFUN_13279 [Planoprotostelium fungivorum]